MSALAKRGLTLEQARANMRWLVNTHGGMKEAVAKLGVPLSTFNSALNGKWGPGEKVLTAMYGPDGTIMLDHLVPPRAGEVWAGSPFRPPGDESEEMGEQEPDDDLDEAEAGVVTASTADLSVSELLARARRRAVEIENDLDEAMGEIITLEQMLERFCPACRKAAE